MKRITNLILLLCIITLSGCCKKENTAPVLIPKPIKMEMGEGVFSLSGNTKINIIGEQNVNKMAYDVFNQQLAESFGQPLEVVQNQSIDETLTIELSSSFKSEEYSISISSDAIQIVGGSDQAISYAFTTLRQMLPTSFENGTMEKSFDLPALSIIDAPRYAYRGTMLDVGRHLSSVEEIKEFIDMLALHKMNRFHWHLTEDQGWRIEIKKYPRLVEIGSKRKETVLGRNSEEYDGKPYGGYYTQEQIKEIVKYAEDRFITIIPEIELPGHAVAALASYPNLGCTGGPYEVRTSWGVADEVFCAGQEHTFEFLEDVLSEVIELFPSKYIHIGGDECPKTSWKKCPKCQRRIKQQGLKDEYELQSYFIQRIEKFIQSKGREIIGWDEILEGGLSKTATVMSWRGVSGGIEAAKMGNDVIMTPNSHMYFDFYQSEDIDNEPLAIGGFLNVERVYSFEPTKGMSEEESHKVIGVQANVWREYMPTFEQVQYMVLPRLSALSEVAWTQKEAKNYNDFAGRALHFLDRYEALGYNYAKHILDVQGKASADTVEHALSLDLFPNYPNVEIRYTMDGTAPTMESTLFTSPIKMKENTTIRAQFFNGEKALGREFVYNAHITKSSFKKIKVEGKFSSQYNANGPTSLVDAIRGSVSISHGNWLGTNSTDVVSIIDLEKEQEIKDIEVGVLQSYSSWILPPKQIIISTSNDGKNFVQVVSKEYGKLDEGLNTLKNSVGKTARFVKVDILRHKVLPKEHPGAGKPAFLFVDEIQVN